MWPGGSCQRLVPDGPARLSADPSAAIPHDVLLPRVWDLRKSLTAYDAVYVALAKALEMPLLTCDANIAGAPGHRARVDVI
jgi:predicted nucleic acid-binding protein